jgi:hypothetical protein
MKYLCAISVLLFLSGCSSFKDITNPLAKKGAELDSYKVRKAPSNIIDANIYVYRPKSLLTIGQKVEIYFNSKEIGSLGHNKELNFKTKTGAHNITTKVGLSMNLPVTGLGGACKFSKDFLFTKPTHYFVIKFKAGLLCGEHRVIELTEKDYRELM